MNPPNRQKFQLPLMLASLVLLGVFQAFWLTKVYREQLDFLKKETDNLFRSAVLDLQDSMVQRSLVWQEGKDSLRVVMEEFRGPDFFSKTDYVKKIIHSKEVDTSLVFNDLKPRGTLKTETKTVVTLRATPDENPNVPLTPGPPGASKIHVFISSDTLQKLPDAPSGLHRFLTNFNDERGTRGEMVFEIKTDSLPTAELTAHFEKMLLAAQLPTRFRLAFGDSLPPPPRGAIATSGVRGGLLSSVQYSAFFTDYQGFVLKKMLPHVLFSLLLFGITAAAFWLVYQSLQQQKRLAELKNDFIANMTHELKTPITTVGVALEALSDFDAARDPELTREYLEISKLELDRLTLLVDKVLRISQFEQRAPLFRPEPLDLAALVGQVAAALRPQLAQANATLHFEAPSEEKFMVVGDRVHLSGVVFNLLDNALKYSRLNPQINIFLKKENGKIQLVVEDEGIGIAPEHQQKIFGKFYRVPTGNTHDVKGHGLGLSYVAGVVRMHEGEIRVESEPGRGSRFTVELPVG